MGLLQSNNGSSHWEVNPKKSEPWPPRKLRNGKQKEQFNSVFPHQPYLKLQHSKPIWVRVKNRVSPILLRFIGTHVQPRFRTSFTAMLVGAQTRHRLACRWRFAARCCSSCSFLRLRWFDLPRCGDSNWWRLVDVLPAQLGREDHLDMDMCTVYIYIYPYIRYLVYLSTYLSIYLSIYWSIIYLLIFYSYIYIYLFMFYLFIYLASYIYL